MSIRWPEALRKVLVQYWRETEKNGHSFTLGEKSRLAADLIRAYNSLSDQDRASFLVPASGAFLKDRALSVRFPAVAVLHPSAEKESLAEITICYEWGDAREGFVPGTDVPTAIENGKLYDRIGTDSGRFLCPIRENGEPENYFARAIPYYIPDELDVRSSPAYHLYQANAVLPVENGYPRCGTIAQTFRTEPDDGGGKQLVLDEKMKIRDLLPKNEGDTECVLICLK